jgi:putative ABC transport system permease protein
VGVLGAKGSDARGNDQDDIIIIPWTSAMKRITGGTTFRSISVQAMDVASSPQVQSDLNDLLRQRHRISEGKEDDFTIRSQQEIADFATASTKVMTVLLGSIAGVSLLVGGIGIMNIMLVSVTERTREIGVRMAIGARGQDILLQFLIEAVVLSVVGGGVGVVFGVAGSYAVAKTQNWVTLVSTSSVVLSFLTSAGIGIFFGFYPARKAAQLDPIEALRFD